MKELEILPLLTYGNKDANQSNFDAIRGLMEATSSLNYAKQEIIKNDLIEFGASSNDDLIEDDLGNKVPIEEQAIFHAPFFFER